MNSSRLIQFQAQVADSERKGVIAGVQQLFNCLHEVAGDIIWRAEVRFDPPMQPMSPMPGVSVIMLSLLPDVDLLDEPIDATEARWHAQLQPLLETGVPVFLRTVFRHVPDYWRDATGALRLERIRRLNRMAADLSLAQGLGVIDIDRAFAHIGGDVLRTDLRLQGNVAAEVAGHTMAWSLLSFGLDDVIDPAIQESARAALGNIHQIDNLLLKRLAPQLAETAAS